MSVYYIHFTVLKKCAAVINTFEYHTLPSSLCHTTDFKWPLIYTIPNALMIA